MYGILANSITLLADAGHYLSDVLGLLLAWGATILARRQPIARPTYGLRRSSMLVALLNAILLLVASGAIAWEAIQRFFEPSSVSGITIIGIATIGIAVNTVSALMFLSGRKKDLNIRRAFLSLSGRCSGIVGCGAGWDCYCYN